MKIRVRHIDDETVEVTLTPGWVGRLFGAKPRRGIAIRNASATWVWKTTREPVPSAVKREIECTTVEDVPSARLVGAGARDPERGWQ